MTLYTVVDLETKKLVSLDNTDHGYLIETDQEKIHEAIVEADMTSEWGIGELEFREVKPVTL